MFFALNSLGIFLNLSFARRGMFFGQPSVPNHAKRPYLFNLVITHLGAVTAPYFQKLTYIIATSTVLH